MNSAAASLSSIRYNDHAARVAVIDVNLGRPMMPPPGRSAKVYRAAYRAAKAAQAAK